MTEQMEIRGTDKPSDSLMVVTNPEGERFLVFDKLIFPHLELGKIVELETKRDIPKKSGDGVYNAVKSITIDGKVIGGKDRKGYAPRGRDEDRTDIRSAQITIKDLWLAGKIRDNNPLVTWLLAELLVIATGKKETKGETSKDNLSNQGAQAKLEQDSEAPKTAGEFLNWIMKRNPNIKAPRVWLQAEYGVTDKEILTTERIKELYDKIKGG